MTYTVLKFWSKARQTSIHDAGVKDLFGHYVQEEYPFNISKTLSNGYYR